MSQPVCPLCGNEEVLLTVRGTVGWNGSTVADNGEPVLPEGREKEPDVIVMSHDTPWRLLCKCGNAVDLPLSPEQLAEWGVG